VSSIQKLSQSYHADWLPLFRGYVEFYKANLSENQYELTWNRLLDDQYNLYGLVAVDDGKVCGITHYSFQTSTRAPNNYCYLEDLFVDPLVRGRGMGRALIDAVKDVAIKSGSSRLYWNTDQTNATARKLYDSYVGEAGKVQYRIPLGPSEGVNT